MPDDRDPDGNDSRKDLEAQIVRFPQSFVPGQTGLMGLDRNRASYYPTPGAMNMPYGSTVQDGLPVIADAGNDRILLWGATP